MPTFTFSKNIWKSSDSGTSWEAKNKGEGKANAKDFDILSLVINPYDADNAYAGLRKGGILETADGGETWKFINNYISEKVYGLALDPIDGKTLYASGVWQGKGKIFKTEDGGETWKELYTSPSKGPIIISLTVDRKNPNIIYATTTEKEAIRSLDGGTSWQNIYLADAPITKISIDASNSSLIYFITDRGSVFRSKNGGADFEKINNKIEDKDFGFRQNNFNVLETDLNHASYVYLAGSGGIIISQDGGENWEKIATLNNPENFPVRVLAINSKNSKEIIYGMAEATYKSVDGGINWATSQFDNKMRVNVLKYDPSGGGAIYLGFTR